MLNITPHEAEQVFKKRRKRVVQFLKVKATPPARTHFSGVITKP